MTRVARCGCARVSATCEGEPVRVSVCHCLACQQRTGGPFAVQARFTADQVRVEGETHSYVRTGDSGRTATFRFCPVCASTIAYEIEALPGAVMIPLGAFADPQFQPWPTYSIYEARQHGWVAIPGDAVEHVD